MEDATQTRPLILVIDDEQGNVMLLEKYLRALGYRVVVTTDSNQGIELAKTRRPDLVLLDIMMPGRDGYEVCKILKGDEALADTLIIFITAKTRLEDRIEGLELGAHDYIVKPFHLPELKARIKAALRVKELQDKLKERNDQLETLAITDGLTGLRNKRYLLERLEEEVGRTARYGNPFSCLMIDIDHFKQINDVHGHQAGDLVLQEIGTTIRRTLRVVDIAARYGGEEFMILLPQTPLAGAVAVAERIRRLIEGKLFALGNSPARVTISVGVAAVPEGAKLDREQLIARADRALYQAKREGRNRVVACSEAEAAPPRPGG